MPVTVTYRCWEMDKYIKEWRLVLTPNPGEQKSVMPPLWRAHDPKEDRKEKTPIGVTLLLHFHCNFCKPL